MLYALWTISWTGGISYLKSPVNEHIFDHTRPIIKNNTESFLLVMLTLLAGESWKAASEFDPRR